MKVPNIKLEDGHEVPQIGLGLWLVKDRAEFDTSFNAGVEAGYRHFDSAQAYDNEPFLGEDLKKSGLKREEVFITTKIKIENFGYDQAAQSIDESLAKLQTDHLDLLLLHFPLAGSLKETWRAAEDAKVVDLTE